MANTINILKPSGCFEVQKIIGISSIHGNCRTYLVQWASSWISGSHLIGCEDLIEQFEHEQKDGEHNIKVEEIDTNHSQDNCGLTDRMNNDKVVIQHDNLHGDSAPQQKIKEVLPANVPKNTDSSPSPNHISHQQSNAGTKVISLDCIIQQISGNNDKQYADRNSVHPDFQKLKTDVVNVKDVEFHNKGHFCIEHEQKEKEVNIKVEEIDTNHSQDNCGLIDTTNTDKLVMQHDNLHVSAPKQQTEKSIQANVSKNTNSTPPPNHINRHSNVGLKVSSFDCIIQQISGNDDKNYVDRNSVHPDFQGMKTAVQNVKGVAFDSKGHLSSNSAEGMVIVKEDTNCGQTKNVRLQNVHYFNGGNRNMAMPSNSFGKSTIKTCRKKKNVNININLLTNKSSRSSKNKIWKNSLERRNKMRTTFQCSICNKVLSCNRDLNNHSRTHKVNHRCATCFKTFAFKENLQKHESIHTACSICKEKFIDLEKLQAHIHTHKTEKADPLECSFCVKRFSSKAPLEIHMRVHTGERPFECKACDMRFKTNHYLQEHIKKHHTSLTI